MRKKCNLNYGFSPSYRTVATLLCIWSSGVMTHYTHSLALNPLSARQLPTRGLSGLAINWILMSVMILASTHYENKVIDIKCSLIPLPIFLFFSSLRLTQRLVSAQAFDWKSAHGQKSSISRKSNSQDFQRWTCKSIFNIYLQQLEKLTNALLTTIIYIYIYCYK